MSKDQINASVEIENENTKIQKEANTLLRFKIVTSIKIQSKGSLKKIRKAQLVNQGPLRMGKRKPKPLNG